MNNYLHTFSPLAVLVYAVFFALILVVLTPSVMLFFTYLKLKVRYYCMVTYNRYLTFKLARTLKSIGLTPIEVKELCDKLKV